MSTRKASFIMGFFVLVIVSTLLPGARHVLAQDSNTQGTSGNGPPRIAQFVALDECDPPTFNAALGPAFCKNVALAAFGYSTTLSNLLAGAQAGHPSPNWDFEPDSMTVSQGTVISVVNQGGEPHTFTEVKNFGGGFLPPLNAPGETTAPECVGGFSTVAVAKTRIIQGSTTLIPNLSKGQHSFQCCIHPWMRVTVNVR